MKVSRRSLFGTHFFRGERKKIIAAHLVAPYRLQGKGGKNDANDAAAVCEAASKPTMRFVPV
jgi:transposase